MALLLWGVLPGLAGFETTVVMSGSMAPQLQVGDAVVTHRVDGAHLAVGQVLLFDDPDHAGRLRMHRLEAIDDGVRLGRLLEDPEERGRRRHRGVRLPAVHRATAVVVTGVALAGALVAPPADAHAAYSATTQNTGDGWATFCGDVTPTGLGSTPRLYWGYGSVTGANVTDLSGQGDTGLLAGDATRTACIAGASPAVTVGASGGGGIIEQGSRAYPVDSTIATWFKTSTAGGVLADFGSSNTQAGSTSIDRLLYMKSDGSLVFGAATVQVGSLMSGVLACTSAPGLADGQWHLVVATWNLTAGCTLTVDNGTAVTASPSLALSLLGGYTGYWRFGYDVPSTSVWPGATPKFVGALDESQIYGAVLGTSARTAIYARGH